MENAQTNNEGKHEENELHLVTKGYKSEGKRYLIDDLEPIHQEAIYLRLEGAEYQYIAKRLKYSYTHVRRLFAEGGICKAAYEELRDEVNIEKREKFGKLKEEIEQAAPEAFNYLRIAARRNWKAAESVMHIAGFTPLQKVEAKVENTNIGKVRETADEIADYVRQNITSGNQKDS